MSRQLDADMNIIQHSGIEIQIDPLTKDLNIIQALDDEPNDVGGLTAQELKAKFDEAGNTIKDYINETLVPEVLSEGITEAQRKENEAARQAAEEEREAHEETREAHETARVLAENARGRWEDYSEAKSYVPGNKVYYLGSSYVNTLGCTGVLPTDKAHWQIIARHGQDGSGRSAYQYAAAGGYTGTEAEFQALMGSGPWVPAANNAGAHNAIYRGRFLGTSVTATQYAAIGAGTFEDLYIGDYWTIGGRNYRIAAFDYYLHSSPYGLAAHHAVIVPDKSMYLAEMNGISTTTGGYIGSELYKTGLNQARTIIEPAFGSHVLEHYLSLTNAVSNGVPSGVAWIESDIDLMNECTVYGCLICAPITDYNSYLDKSQFPLFAMRPDLINDQQGYWLRDVATMYHFSYVDNSGRSSTSGAAGSRGVRPFFCISG